MVGQTIALIGPQPDRIRNDPVRPEQRLHPQGKPREFRSHPPVLLHAFVGRNGEELGILVGQGDLLEKGNGLVVARRVEGVA